MNGTGALVTVIVAIVGLATLAVIVSQNANTAKVLESLGGGVSKVIGAAVAPVSGS